MGLLVIAADELDQRRVGAILGEAVKIENGFGIDAASAETVGGRAVDAVHGLSLRYRCQDASRFGRRLRRLGIVCGLCERLRRFAFGRGFRARFGDAFTARGFDGANDFFPKRVFFGMEVAALAHGLSFAATALGNKT